MARIVNNVMPKGSAIPSGPSNALLGCEMPTSATNPALCNHETMAVLFDAKEAEYEARAAACREPPRDMVMQALHVGFAAGMRFAAEQVRGKPNIVIRLKAEENRERTT